MANGTTKNKLEGLLITPTIASSKVILDSSNSIVQSGKTVCCNLAFKLNGTFSYLESILTGLPKPKYPIYTTAKYQNISENFRINSSGSFVISSGTTYSNQFFTVSFSYVAD